MLNLPFCTEYCKEFFPDPVQTHVNGQEFNRYGASGFLEPVGQLAEEKNDDSGIHAGAKGGPSEVVTGQSIAFQRGMDTDSSSSQSNFHRMEETQKKDYQNSLKSFMVIDPVVSHVPVANALSENSGNTILQNNHVYSNVNSSAGTPS